MWSTTIMYVLFGTVAFVIRDLNPHFLLFLLTGDSQVSLPDVQHDKSPLIRLGPGSTEMPGQAH